MNAARRQFHAETSPRTAGRMARLGGEARVGELHIAKSFAADDVRFPEAAALSECFQAPAVVIDEEHRPGQIPHQSGDVGSDLLHQRARLQVDDVAGALAETNRCLAPGIRSAVPRSM